MWIYKCNICIFCICISVSVSMYVNMYLKHTHIYIYMCHIAFPHSSLTAVSRFMETQQSRLSLARFVCLRYWHPFSFVFTFSLFVYVLSKFVSFRYRAVCLFDKDKIIHSLASLLRSLLRCFLACTLFNLFVSLQRAQRFEKCPVGKEFERNGQLGQFWVEIRIRGTQGGSKDFKVSLPCATRICNWRATISLSTVFVFVSSSPPIRSYLNLPTPCIPSSANQKSEEEKKENIWDFFNIPFLRRQQCDKWW